MNFAQYANMTQQPMFVYVGSFSRNLEIQIEATPFMKVT